MRSAWIAVGLGLALLVPGCSLITEPEPREVKGKTDGYTPTASHLKVFVRENATGHLTLVAFERRDWYVAKIAKSVDDRSLPFLMVHGKARNIMGEYDVLQVLDPERLEGLRYASMAASDEERSLMDAEYDDLLARFAETLVTPEPPEPPLLEPELPAAP